MERPPLVAPEERRDGLAEQPAASAGNTRLNLHRDPGGLPVSKRWPQPRLLSKFLQNSGWTGNDPAHTAGLSPNADHPATIGRRRDSEGGTGNADGPGCPGPSVKSLGVLVLDPAQRAASAGRRGRVAGRGATGFMPSGRRRSPRVQGITACTSVEVAIIDFIQRRSVFIIFSTSFVPAPGLLDPAGLLGAISPRFAAPVGQGRGKIWAIAGPVRRDCGAATEARSAQGLQAVP